MIVEWTEEALDNLYEIGLYIASDRPKTAQRVTQIIKLAGNDMLADYPEVGIVGRVEGTREYAVPRLPYTVVYHIDENRIVIDAIIHQSRNWPEDF